MASPFADAAADLFGDDDLAATGYLRRKGYQDRLTVRVELRIERAAFQLGGGSSVAVQAEADIHPQTVDGVVLVREDLRRAVIEIDSRAFEVSGEPTADRDGIWTVGLRETA